MTRPAETLREQIEADLIEIIGVPDRALARALTTVALKAIEKSGRTIVPLEPTIEMCDAATRSTSAFMALEQRGADLRRLKHGIRYRAMLAARPRDAAPTEESDE